MSNKCVDIYVSGIKPRKPTKEEKGIFNFFNLLQKAKYRAYKKNGKTHIEMTITGKTKFKVLKAVAV